MRVCVCVCALVVQHDISYDFSFYFDTSGNRTCNLAPERIYAPEPGVGIESRLVPKHDIFSLGYIATPISLSLSCPRTIITINNTDSCGLSGVVV